jgi:hemolysin type calcium-binding protein
MGALPRRPLVLTLTLLVPLLLPTVATAGTAELTTSTFGGRADETVLFAHLAYTARRGEVNRLRVLFDATGATIIDRAGVAPGRGCARIRDEERLKVRCDFGGATVAELRVSLGDRGDVAHERGRIPEYEGGIGGMLAIVGGPGDDRLDSGDANGTLSGGGGDDLLRSQHGAVFVGGPGNDRMLGGAGFDTFRAGADLDGRDTMLGGGGRDAVSYEARRARVHADLKGDRDDGTPGELDRIGSDVEDLTGGDGPDRLVGNRRRNRLVAGGGRDLLVGLGGPDELDGQQPHGRATDDGDRMLGGSGDDSLNGGAGNDVLVGGAGWDIAQAGPGDDTVIARDSGPDQITCGGGRDRLNLDRWDWFEARYGACESVRRSAPPVAVAIFVRRRLSYHVDRPVALAEVGCPGDARVTCTGTAEIISEGGSRATVDIRLRPGELAFPEVQLDTATWEAAKNGARPRVQLVLRVREPHGNVVRLVYAVRIE